MPTARARLGLQPLVEIQPPPGNLREPIGSQCFHSNWSPSEWKPERLERGTKDTSELHWQVLPPGLAVPTARHPWALRGSPRRRLQLQPREATRAP